MPIDASAWTRARRAKANLERAILADPAVTLIDIGLVQDPDSEQALALRVHLRAEPRGPARVLPADVDGVAVVILPGDYQPDQ